jgi:hypothetical protein
MRNLPSHDIRLELSDLRELFVAPELDPLAGQPFANSGIDRILSVSRARPNWPVRATLVLPAAARADDLELRTRAALEQYCDSRLTQIGHDATSLRHEGFATLWRGVLFLACCMLAARLVGEPRFLPDIVGRFLNEGFIIAGWVALWYPLDVLLYQRWPLWRERRLYQRVRDMTLVFEFAPPRQDVREGELLRPVELAHSGS